MASTTSSVGVHEPSAASRRAGYVIAVAVNAVLLWVTLHLLDWGWPRFLTDEFEEVLPSVTASFVASIVANACFVVVDRGRFRAAADLVVGAFGLAAMLRTWQVFPFSFSSYDHDWAWAVRGALVVAIGVSAVAVVVQAVRLIRGTDTHSER